MNYRILNIDGTLSSKIFTLVEYQNNQKAILRSIVDNKDISVHKNRIVPFEDVDRALCIVSGGIDLVICPRCLGITNKEFGIDTFVCEQGCGSYQFHSLDSDSSAVRSTKIMNQKSKNIFDLEAVGVYKSMVVYSKTNKFNHPSIDSRSIIILHNSDKPRKMQFNIYNNSLGKKSGALPLDAFNKNEPPSGKCPWSTIANVDAEVKRLLEDGYQQIL